MKSVHMATGKHDGFWNMAFDRLLMEQVGRGRWSFVLRTYGWDPACVSIGKLQKPSREIDTQKLLSHGYGLVRRPTGGRAVWHETELTYSIVAPRDHPAVSGPITEALRKTSLPMLAAIRSLGIPAEAGPWEKHNAGGPRMEANPCFTSHGRWEIGTSDGRKMVGSAQARNRGVFLEHGSILFGNDQPKMLEYLPETVSPRLREMLESHLSTGIACLCEFSPGLTVEEMENALRQAFSEALGEEIEEYPYRELQGSRLRELEMECRDDL